MSGISKRLFGDRSVDWKVLGAITAAVGICAIGFVLLSRVQTGRQTETIRAQIALAEAGKGAEKLETLYERLLRFEPRDADVLAKHSRAKAKSARTTREQQAALKLLDRAVRENPSDVELRRSLIALAMLTSMDELCNPEPHLEHLRTELPSSAEPCEQLAKRAEGRDDLTAAERHLKEALKRDSKHIPSVLRYARLQHFRLRREKEAAALVGAAAKEKLASLDRLAVAEFWNSVGEFDRRNGAVQSALKEFPNDADVLLAAVDCLEDRRNKQSSADPASASQQATALLERGRNASPDRPEFYVRLASREVRKNRPAEAKRIVEEGLAAAPGSFQLRWAKCEALLAMPQRPELAADLDGAVQEVRELEPRPEALQFLEARVAFARRKFAEAVVGFERAVPQLASSDSFHRQALLLLGDAYRELGEPSLRESAYRRLLSVEPTNADAYAGLGESLAEQGRYDDAVSQLSGVLRRVAERDQPRIATTLLTSLVRREAAKDPKQRQWKEVDRILDAVERQDPGNPLAMSLRVERLSVEKRFKDAAVVVDRFIQFKSNAPDQDPEGKRMALAEAFRAKATALLSANDLAGARTVVAEGRKRLGDAVPLRIADAFVLCVHGAPEDRKPLDRLAVGDEAFAISDRLVLLRMLASLRHSLGDEAAALELYSKASALNPLDQSLQRPLFLLALDLGDLKQAEASASAIGRTNSGPGSPAACARALLALRGYEADPKPSELRLQTVNLLGCDKHYKSWVGVPMAVARVADLENKRKEAVVHYRAAFEANAPNPRIARRMLQLLAQAGDYLEAANWLAASRLETADAAIVKAAAEVAVRTGDHARTSSLAARAAPVDSNDDDLLVWAGVILQAAQQPAEAETRLRRAVEVAPAKAAPLTALVEFLVRQDKKPEARRELEAGLPRIAEPDRTLAAAKGEEALGDLSSARRLVDQEVGRPTLDVKSLQYAVEFYLRIFDFEGAMNAATRIESLSEIDADQRAWAARMKGVVLVAAGRPDEARRALAGIGSKDAANDASGDLKYDVRTRAMILALQPNTQSWRDALNELARLEVLGVSEFNDQLTAAQIEERLGRWSDAKSRLMKLAEGRQGGHPRVVSMMVKGLITHEGVTADVEPWLTRFERLEPNGLDAVYLRARWIELRDRDAAAAHVSKLAADGKIDGLSAGLTLVELNRDDAAVGYFKAAAGDPSGPPTQQQLGARLHLARSLAKSGKAVESLAVCRSMQQVLPPAGYAQIYLEALNSTSDADLQGPAMEFGGWLDVRLKETPRDFGLQLAAAALDSRMGRHARAVERLRGLKASLSADDPMAPAVANNLAFLTAFVDRQPQAAAKILVDQLARTPSQLELRDTLGVVRLEQGKADEALADLRELSVLLPTGVVHFHLARAHAAKKDALAAKAAWERALKLGFRKEDLHELERPSFEALLASLKL